MSRSQLREQICQTSKSDRQESQSLVVLLIGTNIFPNGTNIYFLNFICGILNRGMANSFWNHVTQISSKQMYFQDIYSNLWKLKVYNGNIFSLKSNTYFWGTVMFVQDGFLYLIVTRLKLTVCSDILTLHSLITTDTPGESCVYVISTQACTEEWYQPAGVPSAWLIKATCRHCFLSHSQRGWNCLHIYSILYSSEYARYQYPVQLSFIHMGRWKYVLKTGIAQF